ncbi:MAG: hypothetical protein MMC33_007586 [Icmadophila ericetorum]|nr:hypothetical protein [Icmadophila ericetorum]
MDSGSDPFPPSLPSFDSSPHIYDTDMQDVLQTGDVFFNSALTHDSPGPFLADEMFLNSPYQSPLSIKSQNMRLDANSKLNEINLSTSPDSSLQDSSSESSSQHKRKTSSRSSHSGLLQQDMSMNTQNYSGSWGNAESRSNTKTITEFTGSNNIASDFNDRAMEHDFDFDSAASSPSPNMNSRGFAFSGNRHIAIPNQMSPRSPANFAKPENSMNAHREASPLSRLFPSEISAQDVSRPAQFNRNGDYIDGAVLNGLGPSTGWQYSQQTTFGHFAPGPMNIATAPYSSNGEAEPSAKVMPCLIVHPTPHKSRVETQIPIKLTLYPIPSGVTKLHLPPHTISKPKLMAKPPPEKSPDMLELHTSLVCTSAMQDPIKLSRAFARAANSTPGVKTGARRASSGDTSLSDTDDENKPLNGGEVSICSGCINRERKRAARKKAKKPEEEELWAKDESERIIVFNCSEIKEWHPPTAPEQQNGVDQREIFVPEGASQIDVPMRIACYCRHQNEKLGFQVIFTIKDHKDNLVAQTITSPITITDDHKNHAPPSGVPSLGTGISENTQLPGGGIFLREPLQHYITPPVRTAHSTSDLQRLQQSFNPQYGPFATSPFAIPQQPSQTTSSTLTPRNLSRQASPTPHMGPTAKRRKASGSYRVPDGLTMTRLQSSNSSNKTNDGWMANDSSNNISASSSPYTPDFPMNPTFVEMPIRQPQNSGSVQLNAIPPAPTTIGNEFMISPNRSQSMENLASMQHNYSAPNSNRASRATSPVINNARPNVSQGQVHTAASSLYSNANPQRTPTIHKLIPNEGPKAGGIEVTCLGSGFSQGLEVMFGDSLATTTTYWGETSLVCLLPPAVCAGTVAVTLKHNYQQQRHMQLFSPTPVPKQQVLFKYIDDDEQALLRHALAIVHQKMTGRIEDAGEIARRIIGSPAGSNGWTTNASQGGDHQRQMAALQASLTGPMDSETALLKCLELIDFDDSQFQAQYNLQRPNGQSVLHLSASLGFERLVAGLLARGANPDLRDRNGMSPMHMAALNGHPHIVRRLLLARGDPSLRSLRGYTPADMASSAAVLNAVKTLHHTRSRSAGANSTHSRCSSTTSLRSLWDPRSLAGSVRGGDTSTDDSDDSPDETAPSESGHSLAPANNWTHSRQNSIVAQPDPAVDDDQENIAQVMSILSPTAAMTAWRDHLATQIQYFQHNVNWSLPNLQLPTLPPMPNLPTYQTYPVVRQFSALMPQRGLRQVSPSGESSDASSDAKETDYRWWELLTGTATSPPAYEEIYPAKGSGDVKADIASTKEAVIHAIVDRKMSFAADQAQLQSESSVSIATTTARDDTVTIQQHEIWKQQAHAQKVKRLRSDRKLFFIWIPLLIIVMVAMLKDRIPLFVIEFWQLYETVHNRCMERGIIAH